MIDASGFRENVGIILTNEEGALFLGKRTGQNAWQFPQGGVDSEESLEESMYRELYEEVGLKKDHVEVLGVTKHWLRYRLPTRLIRETEPACIGQKQRWFLLRLCAEENTIKLDIDKKPEFDGWMWVSYWYPLRAVISFKKHVYRAALTELLPILSEKVVSNLRNAQPLNHLLGD